MYCKLILQVWLGRTEDCPRTMSQARLFYRIKSPGDRIKVGVVIGNLVRLVNFAPGFARTPSCIFSANSDIKFTGEPLVVL